MELELRKRVTCIGDFRPENHAQSPLLGRRQTDEMLGLARCGDTIEGDGKAAVVGTAGEIGHATALIRTVRFGNHSRHALEVSIGGRPHDRLGDCPQDLEELGGTHD